MNDFNQFKNNGFLVKKNLINQKEINKINKIVNEIISKEKQKKRSDTQNRTQSYDNYHFVYNSNSSKNNVLLVLPPSKHCILIVSLNSNTSYVLFNMIKYRDVSYQ